MCHFDLRISTTSRFREECAQLSDSPRFELPLLGSNLYISAHAKSTIAPHGPDALRDVTHPSVQVAQTRDFGCKPV